MTGPTIPFRSFGSVDKLLQVNNLHSIRDSFGLRLFAWASVVEI